MRRITVLAAVLLAAALAAVLGLGRLAGPGPGELAGSAGGAGAAEPDVGALLVGRGQETPAERPVDPLAGETDLAVLVPQAWRGGPAQRRLLELAAADATVLAALVDWLRPGHDHERVPALPAGQRYSGPTVSPALAALGNTLVQLAPASVPLLIAALEDDDLVFRERVMEVLGRLPAHADVVVPALLARLGNDREEEDVGAQVAVLRALGALGGAAVGASDVFLTYMRDDVLPDDARAAVAESVFDVVGTTYDAFDACGLALRDQSYEMCIRLVPSLAALGAQAAPVVPDLVGIVQDPTAHAGVRQLAVEALGRIGVSGDTVVHALLVVALDDEQEAWMQRSAMLALGRIGGEAADLLLRRLSRVGTDTTCLAVSALHEAEAIPVGRLLTTLEPLRTSDWPEERWRALRTGAALHGEPGVLVPWLARWMEDETVGMRPEVLRLASGVPDDSGAVIELLVAALDDEDPEVRDAALQGLTTRAVMDHGDGPALRRTAVVDAVRRRLADPLPQLQIIAAWWIAEVAPTYDAEALPVWIRQIESGSWRPGLLAVLQRLGSKAPAALPALEAERDLTKTPRRREQLQATIDAIRGR